MARAGIVGQTYLNVGTYDTPEWYQVKILHDLTIEVTATEIQVRNKGSRYVKYLMGLEDAPIDTEYDWAPEDQAFQKMHEAHYKRTYLDLVFLDGKINQVGATGFRGDFLVTKWGDSQPLDDAEVLTAALRLAAESPNEPGPVKVMTGGALERIYVDENGNEIAAANAPAGPLDSMMAAADKKSVKTGKAVPDATA